MSIDTYSTTLREWIQPRHEKPLLRVALIACGWLSLMALAAVLAAALDGAPISPVSAIGGGLTAILAMALVVGRYDLAVVIGFVLLGVVVVEPAPSDVLF